MPTPNFNKLKQGPSAGTKSVASATLAFAGSQRPDTVVPKIAEQEIFLSAIQEREENTFALINIDSLADSIYDYGLIEPISVWKRTAIFPVNIRFQQGTADSRRSRPFMKNIRKMNVSLLSQQELMS